SQTLVLAMARGTLHWIRRTDCSTSQISGRTRSPLSPPDRPNSNGLGLFLTLLVSSIILEAFTICRSARPAVPGQHQQAEEFKKSPVARSPMHKITPFLWFDGKAEEAAKFYASIFKNSKIGKITRYGKEGYEVHRRPAGTVMTVEFQIDGQKFVALNGGPEFKFTDAVSFAVGCKSQEEVDMFWEKLGRGRGGKHMRVAQGQPSVSDGSFKKDERTIT